MCCATRRVAVADTGLRGARLGYFLASEIELEADFAFYCGADLAEGVRTPFVSGSLDESGRIIG